MLEAKPTEGYAVLRLTFADGTSGEVDVLGRMRGPVFERARTPEGVPRGPRSGGHVAMATLRALS